MLTFKSERRVGDHYELEFSFKGELLVAKLRAAGPPAFENGTYPKQAVDALDLWAHDDPENISRLQSTLR